MDGLHLNIEWSSERLPEAWYSNLLIDGLLSGVGGIIIFVPQMRSIWLHRLLRTLRVHGKTGVP